MKTTRRIVQGGFLGLTLVGVFVLRENAEMWCPFGGVEALYTYVTLGQMTCSLGTSNFFILAGVLLTALLARRAFCGYMCPIGTISKWLHAFGRRLRIPALGVSGPADRILALLKYLVLAVILFFTWRYGELLFRGYDPCYALISRHGTDITVWAYVVSGAIVICSLLIVIPFCRWLCPLAAVLHPFSRFALTRIKRDAEACTNCRQCAKACPMVIPVDQLTQVTSARCISCMSCVDACPQKRSEAVYWGPINLLGRRWPGALLVASLLVCTTVAVGASYMFPLPSYVKSRRESLPERTATVRLKVDNVTCRGRANLLFWYLDRDDMDQIPGWFKLAVWPGPGLRDVHVSYDADQTDDESIKRAITEWYYDVLQDRWRESPFVIEGYDPLGLGLEDGFEEAP